MALGLYKPGQGYWVRVMTACLVGLLTVATAGWLWTQGDLLAAKLPKAGYTLALRSVGGEPAPGQTLDLIGPADRVSTQPVIGTAVAKSYRAAEQAVVVSQVQMAAEKDGKVRDVSEAVAVKAAGGLEAVVRSAIAIPAVEPLYIKGGLASVAIIAGAVLAYWLAGMRPRTVDFLIATDFEMKKVNWSTFREIRGSTIVVIGACFLISASLFSFDFFFKTLFQAIGVLAK